MALIGPILFPLVPLLTSGILMLILMILGHSPGFSRLFSVAIHSFWAYSVVAYTLALAVLYLSQDPSLLDPRNLVLSHLGVLVDQTESPVLFTLAASFDLVTFLQSLPLVPGGVDNLRPSSGIRHRTGGRRGPVGSMGNRQDRICHAYGRLARAM